MSSDGREFQRWSIATCAKWAAMVAGIFWTLIYHLGNQAAHLPEFVYVNF